MKIIWGFFALIVVAFAALTLKPELVAEAAPLTLRTPIAQMIAMRGWLMVGMFATAVFFMIIGAIRSSLFDRGRIAFTLAAALGVIAVLHGVTIYSRGIENPANLAADPGITFDSQGNGAITILQYNTRGGEVGAAAIADLVVAQGIDALSLSETSTATGNEIVAELADRDLDFQQFDTATAQTAADYGSTVLLISKDLGKYSAATVDAGSTNYRSVIRAVPVDGTGPDFISIHAVAPSSVSTKQWRTEIESAYKICEMYPQAVYAGDFNSTVDHERILGLGTECNDAVRQAGSGGLGTWPANLPTWLGSPIDRVMAPTGYKGSEAAIVELGGSDHRGVLVRIVPEK